MSIERGVRYTPTNWTVRSVVCASGRYARQPFLINDVEDVGARNGYPVRGRHGRTITKSVAFAPLIVGAEVARSHLAPEPRPDDAFSEADVRLLTTLASSLSVALENARLFDETQRLLTETNERAAELAIINSVQQGLAEQLDMQAMYDLVGDKIQEIFDAQVVDIGIYDFETQTIAFPYTIERGRALRGRRRCRSSGYCR